MYVGKLRQTMVKSPGRIALVSEGSFLKSRLTSQVEALDLDSLPNAGIRFMIGAGDRDGHFTINSDDGYISVNSELDRETVIIDISLFYIGLKRDTWPQIRNSTIVFNKVRSSAFCVFVYKSYKRFSVRLRNMRSRYWQ